MYRVVVALLALSTATPAAADLSDLKPLLGEWRSVSSARPNLVRPTRSVVIYHDRIAYGRQLESVRQVNRRANIVAVQTGSMLVYNFELLGPNRMCRVGLGHPNPIPRVVTRAGRRAKTIYDCYERVRSSGG